MGLKHFKEAICVEIIQEKIVKIFIVSYDPYY